MQWTKQGKCHDFQLDGLCWMGWRLDACPCQRLPPLPLPWTTMDGLRPSRLVGKPVRRPGTVGRGLTRHPRRLHGSGRPGRPDPTSFARQWVALGGCRPAAHRADRAPSTPRQRPTPTPSLSRQSCGGCERNWDPPRCVLGPLPSHVTRQTHWRVS